MKDKNNPHKSRGVGKTIAAVVIAILLLAGAGYFIYAYFQVEDVAVSGNVKYDSSYIAKIANIPPKMHMFLVDTNQIKENIETEPYLEVANITKQYPKTLAIEVKERTPEALIAASEQYLLADINANVLEILPAQASDQYPLVEGFILTSANLGKQVSTEDAFKISVYTDLLNALKEKDMIAQIALIDLTDVNSIKLKTREGLTVKFGQAEKFVDKVKWIKRTIPKLTETDRTSGTLDVSSGAQASVYASNNTPEPDTQEPVDPNATQSQEPDSQPSE